MNIQEKVSAEFVHVPECSNLLPSHSKATWILQSSKPLLLTHTDLLLSSGGSWTEIKHQDQIKSLRHSRAAGKYFPPFPRGFFYSQLGSREDLLPIGVTGWAHLLPEGQTNPLGLTPQLCRALGLLFARRPSRAIQRPLEAPESCGAMGRAWGSLSVIHVSQVGEACAHLCAGGWSSHTPSPTPVPPVWGTVARQSRGHFVPWQGLTLRPGLGSALRFSPAGMRTSLIHGVQSSLWVFLKILSPMTIDSLRDVGLEPQIQDPQRCAVP